MYKDKEDKLALMSKPEQISAEEVQEEQSSSTTIEDKKDIEHNETMPKLPKSVEDMIDRLVKKDEEHMKGIMERAAAREAEEAQKAKEAEATRKAKAAARKVNAMKRPKVGELYDDWIYKLPSYESYNVKEDTKASDVLKEVVDSNQAVGTIDNNQALGTEDSNQVVGTLDSNQTEGTVDAKGSIRYSVKITKKVKSKRIVGNRILVYISSTDKDQPMPSVPLSEKKKERKVKYRKKLKMLSEKSKRYQRYKKFGIHMDRTLKTGRRKRKKLRREEKKIRMLRSKRRKPKGLKTKRYISRDQKQFNVWRRKKLRRIKKRLMNHHVLKAKDVQRDKKTLRKILVNSNRIQKEWRNRRPYAPKRRSSSKYSLGSLEELNALSREHLEYRVTKTQHNLSRALSRKDYKSVKGYQLERRTNVGLYRYYRDVRDHKVRTPWGGPVLLSEPWYHETIECALQTVRQYPHQYKIGGWEIESVRAKVGFDRMSVRIYQPGDRVLIEAYCHAVAPTRAKVCDMRSFPHKGKGVRLMVIYLWRNIGYRPKRGKKGGMYRGIIYFSLEVVNPTLAKSWILMNNPIHESNTLLTEWINKTQWVENNTILVNPYKNGRPIPMVTDLPVRRGHIRRKGLLPRVRKRVPAYFANKASRVRIGGDRVIILSRRSIRQRFYYIQALKKELERRGLRIGNQRQRLLTKGFAFCGWKLKVSRRKKKLGPKKGKGNAILRATPMKQVANKLAMNLYGTRIQSEPETMKEHLLRIVVPTMNYWAEEITFNRKSSFIFMRVKKILMQGIYKKDRPYASRKRIPIRKPSILKPGSIVRAIYQGLKYGGYRIPLNRFRWYKKLFVSLSEWEQKILDKVKRVKGKDSPKLTKRKKKLRAKHKRYVQSKKLNATKYRNDIPKRVDPAEARVLELKVMKKGGLAKPTPKLPLR